MNTTKGYGLIPRFTDIETVRKAWGWFLTLGILNIILGVIAISYATAATLFSVLVFGLVLGVSGIFQIVHAFWARKWSGLFVSLLLGIVYIVTAAICFMHPLESAASLTLIIAMFCFIVGLFRIFLSLIQRFEQWGWMLFNGIVTFLLGILILSEWPLSGLWVIGLFVGIDMLFSGIGWTTLALAARRSLSM